MHSFWQPLLVIAKKDLRLLVRDRLRLLMTVAWPLVIAIFFGSFAPGPGADGMIGGLEILWVTPEGPEAPPSDEVHRVRGQLEQLPGVELLDSEHSAARQRIREGTAAIYLELKATRPHPVLNYGADPRRSAELSIFRAMLRELGQRQALEQCPNATKVDYQYELRANPSTKPTEKQAAAPSNYAVTFPQGLIWAVINCIATFGLSLAQEAKTGTLARLRLAPISEFTVLAGKALACLVTLTSIEAIILLVGVSAFGLRPEQPLALATVLLIINLGFAGLMMLIAVLGRRSDSAAGLAWALLTAFAMLGGGMLPLFMMPDWMRLLSQVSPVQWALIALEGAIWRGFEFADFLRPCGLMLTVGSLAFVVGARLYLHGPGPRD